MREIKDYESFKLNLIIEKVDYEWDLERGLEIDYNRKIVKEIKNSALKSKNKKKWFSNLLKNLKDKKPKVRKNIITLMIPFMLLHTDMKKEEIKELVEEIDIKIENEVEKIIEDKKRDPLILDPSDRIKDFIKKEEGLSLEAYDIGDGMITIGYGHAERKSNSKFKKGDVITQRKANELFKEDLKEATEGIKRIFEDWNEEGIHIKITQNQFDALVSLAFNTGVQSVRDSKFIQSIKKQDFLKASSEIENYDLERGYSGLIDRRKTEKEIFNS
jgi:lysozyme